VKAPNIQATPFLANLALRFEDLRCMLGAKRILTKETVVASRNKSYFNNGKFSDEFKVDFQPIKPVIMKTAGYFIRDLREGWFDKGFRHWNKPGENTTTL